MDAVATPASARSAAWGLVVFAALVGGPLAFSLGFAADSKLLPQGSGLRDGRDPEWSTDANDPFPMPPEFANATYHVACLTGYAACTSEVFTKFWNATLQS